MSAAVFKSVKVGVLMERITDVIAAMGVATWFTPELYDWAASTSQFAALMMPIFGCVWLGVQIWSRLVRGK
jgi:hypothetical protein